MIIVVCVKLFSAEVLSVRFAAAELNLLWDGHCDS